MKVLIVLLALIAVAYGQNCVADGTYCQKCSESVNYCNGVNDAGSCVAATNSLPSGSPCSGVSTGDNVCTLGTTVDLSVYTTDALNAAINNSNNFVSACKSDSNRNSDCCPKACNSASSCDFCPQKCSSSGSTSKTVTTVGTVNGSKYCYKTCTSCTGYGGTTTFCNNNCGSSGLGLYACSGDSACCNAAASLLSSWLFW